MTTMYLPTSKALHFSRVLIGACKFNLLEMGLLSQHLAAVILLHLKEQPPTAAPACQACHTPSNLALLLVWVVGLLPSLGLLTQKRYLFHILRRHSSS